MAFQNKSCNDVVVRLDLNVLFKLIPFLMFIN